MSKNKKDYDDRKSLRRESLSKKKTFINQPADTDELKRKNKIKNEFRSRKIDMSQDELWEDWEEQLDKYKK